MKQIKVSFDTWIQLIGMFSIVASLIFVGLEMKAITANSIGSSLSKGSGLITFEYLTVCRRAKLVIEKF